MLRHLLSGGGGWEYVGGFADEFSGDGSPSLDLSTLTGGIGTAPVAGDLVVAVVAFTSLDDKDITAVSSGYTESIDTAEAPGGTGTPLQFGAYYKRLTAAETAFEVSLGGDTGSSVMAAQVWRGSNATTPRATGVGSGVGVTSGGPPDPPSILDTTVNNQLVIAIGAQCGSSGGNAIIPLTVPTGMSHMVASALATDVVCGLCSKILNPSQNYDPAAFGGGGSGTETAWVAVTLVFNPA